MSVARLRRKSQAPLGAACWPASWRKPVMPLLTELENNLVEPPCYKHGAPNGACRLPRWVKCPRHYTPTAVPALKCWAILAHPYGMRVFGPC